MDLEKVKEFIVQKHQGQKRKQGTPYYLHPYAVAEILKEKGFPVEYQIAGLLHDTLEDTDTTFEELEDLTSSKIASAVRLVTKEKGYKVKDYYDRILKNDMAKMVKLADRLHNLLDAVNADAVFQEKYIKETEEWYVPMAKETCFEEDVNKALNNLKRVLAESKEER